MVLYMMYMMLVQSNDSFAITENLKYTGNKVLNNNQFCVGEKTIDIAVDLHPQTNWYVKNAGKADIYKEEWTNEYIFIDFDVKMTDPSFKIKLYADYLHTIQGKWKPYINNIVGFSYQVYSNNPTAFLAVDKLVKTIDASQKYCGDDAEFFFLPQYK